MTKEALQMRKSTVWMKAVDNAINDHNWTEKDFINFISPRRRGCDFTEHLDDSDGSIYSSSLRALPDDPESEFTHRSATNIGEAFQIFSAIMGKSTKPNLSMLFMCKLKQCLVASNNYILHLKLTC